MDPWYLYILAGLLAGLVSALFGVGGGVLMVPILALAFGFSQKSAQGMSLLIMIPMVLAGAIRYYVNPNIPIHLPVSGMIAVGGVFGAVLGSRLVFLFSDLVLKRSFACFIILIGINMLVKSFTPRPEKEAPHVAHSTQRTAD
jgi:uncharacterized membrane protein YfcA